ncbi:Uncharacterised protein [Klebsiella pneumoniae]|nr:Uncharacterised protein [Klebsiella pneumoniae]
MMSLWDALRMNMMISYQELVRTFLRLKGLFIGCFDIDVWEWGRKAGLAFWFNLLKINEL